MPTTAVATFSGKARIDPLFAGPFHSIRFPVALIASITYVQGTVIGEVAATPGTYKAYASGNSDGSQNPTGLLEYASATDASGNITYVGEFGYTAKTVPMYIGGRFRSQEITGLDANAVTKLGGVIVEGSVTTGIFQF